MRERRKDFFLFSRQNLGRRRMEKEWEVKRENGKENKEERRAE